MMLNPGTGCGCCTKGNGIGFDFTSDFNLGKLDPAWFAQFTVVVYQAVTLELLNKVNYLMCGLNVDCNDPVRYLPAAEWPAVAKWLKGGGRIWFQSEFGTRTPLGPNTTCVTNLGGVNGFLAAIGSAIRCNDDVADSNNQVYDQADLTGSSALWNGKVLWNLVTASVSGGTGLFQYSAKLGDGFDYGLGGIVLAIEKVGSGYIVVSGDSNVFGTLDPTIIPMASENMPLIEFFFSKKRPL